MKMFDAELVLVLELLELLLRCLLVVLLILRSGLGTCLELLTNKQDLAVLVIDVLGLDFGPCKAAELLNYPADS
jgi:hypothetical protein